MINPFEALGLREELVRAVEELGFEQPTEIQRGAIPPLLDGRDVLGQAQTGTGKTAAFALPVLQRIDLSGNGVRAIMLTPTRELALQVAEAVELYGKHRNARVAPIYGGAAYARQIKKLRDGAQIVVGTPGRVLDLLNRGVLDLSHVEMVVLDEADRMLDLGFAEDVETIVNTTPAERQTALFSATFPTAVKRLARSFMRDPVTVRIEHKTLTVEQTEQRYYLVRQSDKESALMRLLEAEDVKSALIFMRTKLGAAALAESLIGRGYPVEAIHGDLAQDVREMIMRRFRQGWVTTLVATDVMARGLDIESVSHVINYDIPFDPEDYVHRIGRTGRAGRDGVAITLVTPREHRLLKTIERYTRQPIERGKLPTREEVLAVRDTRFVDRLRAMMGSEELARERELITQLAESGIEATEVAAILMQMARSVEALRPLDDVHEVVERPHDERRDRRDQRGRGDRFDRYDDRPSRRRTGREAGMVRMMVDAWRADGVQPGDIVGAVASEANIPGKSIGAIDLEARRSFFDIREEHADRVLRSANRITLRGVPARVRVADDDARPPHRSHGGDERPGNGKFRERMP
ncbi:MAG: DEAD/DEAH box helicase [Anaerolineae bacterium]|nr:DEAD/DEAH box helicase [Anaerolineae bacterium]